MVNVATDLLFLHIIVCYPPSFLHSPLHEKTGAAPDELRDPDIPATTLRKSQPDAEYDRSGFQEAQIRVGP